MGALNMGTPIQNKKRTRIPHFSFLLPLRSDSFALSTGDIVFIKGPSGIGKTLLLRSLACLDAIEVTTRPNPLLPPCPQMLYFFKKTNSTSTGLNVHTLLSSHTHKPS